MPKVKYKPNLEHFQGTLYDVVFKLSPQGEPIVTKRPDMSNVEWSEAQTAQRSRFSPANEYAKVVMAVPEVRAIYEEMAAQEHRPPYRVAFSDYFKGNDLLTNRGAGPEAYSPSDFKRASRPGSCSASHESFFKISYALEK